MFDLPCHHHSNEGNVPQRVVRPILRLRSIRNIAYYTTATLTS
jgi:hypothetical protein